MWSRHRRAAALLTLSVLFAACGSEPASGAGTAPPSGSAPAGTAASAPAASATASAATVAPPTPRPPSAPPATPPPGPASVPPPAAPAPLPPVDPDITRPATGLDVTGVGDGRVPQAAASTFIIQDNWSVSYAWSCPPGTAGPNGMGSVVHGEVSPGVPGLASPGDDPIDMTGDLGHASQYMPHGGELFIKVTAQAAACHWRIVVYGRTA